MRSISIRLSILCLSFVTAACTSGGQSLTGEGGAGGQDSSGGTPGSGGESSSGGASASGGATGSGGATASGGTTGSGGSTTAGEGGVGAGGTSAAGGTKASGGATSSGGSAGSPSGGSAGSPSGGQAAGGSGGSGRTGGTTAAGGQAGRGTGGVTIPGTGGRTTLGTGGRTGTGGAGAGGSTSTGTGTSTVDCNAKMPTGGTEHCGQNTQGKAGDLMWSLWSNAINGNGCITTFNTPAFSARWNNNNDFLARLGLEFGNAGKTYDQYGTLKADFTFKKSGNGGGYSYIGIYGWTNNPCVEWYIVDDRYGTMPFNAYNATQKGTATIDGEAYKLFQNKTSGTGGSRCSGVSQWDQFWSIRQKARQCGTITISEHFKAWEAAGLKMGGLLEAKILVETGGDNGSIEFPVANVTAE
ncbi:MAG: glycoside hydrolase family 11 protein [Deltaproteobacteria bacterium]|nr:glycoside hydrolase family 11 protein [Deltaproteobacteria bacterium]